MVLGNLGALQLIRESYDTFRDAWVVQHIDDRVARRIAIARFVRSEDNLQFFWETDCGIADADLLRSSRFRSPSTND